MEIPISQEAEMNRSKNHLIVAAVFAVLAVIGTTMNTRRVGGPGAS